MIYHSSDIIFNFCLIISWWRPINFKSYFMWYWHAPYQITVEIQESSIFGHVKNALFFNQNFTLSATLQKKFKPDFCKKCLFEICRYYLSDGTNLIFGQWWVNKSASSLGLVVYLIDFLNNTMQALYHIYIYAIVMLY